MRWIPFRRDGREVIDHDTLDVVDEFPIVESSSGVWTGPKIDYSKFRVAIDDDPGSGPQLRNSTQNNPDD